MFGIPSSLDRDLCSGAFDLAQIVTRQLNRDCSNVFFQTMQLGRARNWNDPWLLGEQPRKCDLSRRRLFPLCNLGKKIHQRLIRFPVLRRKARERAAEIIALDRGVFVNFPSEEAFPKRAIWNKTNSQFL